MTTTCSSLTSRLLQLAVLLASSVCLVHAGLTVQVQMLYPLSNFNGGSTTVGLRGSFPLSWETSAEMHMTADNTWSTSFAIDSSVLNATFPQFAVDAKIILNESVWQLGCNSRFSFTYTGSSGGETSVTVYPYFFQATGATTTVRNVYSPQLNNSRDVWLYVPALLIENDAAVASNVLVMHDGQNLEPLWQVDTHLNTLIAQGLMEPVFVVGPYNTPDRIAEYTYSVDPAYGGGKGDLYLNFLQDTLIPMIGDEYNIDTSQPSLGIMGSSLGGLISCYAGVTRPAIYSTVGCMSSSFWWNNGDFLATIVPRIQVSTANTTQQFYVDSGDSGDTDDDIFDTSKVSTAFVRSGAFELGRNFFWYMDRGGQHNEGYWSARFHFSMQWLYFRSAINNANGL